MPRLFHFHFSPDERCNQLSIYHATQKEIDEFPFQNYPVIHHLSICCGYIQHFRIPEGVQDVTISQCALRELYVPDSVDYLNISNNYLTRLELPENLGMVRAQHNFIETVTFRSPPKRLKMMILYDNCLEELDFEAPPSLDYIDVRANPLNIKMPDSIRKILHRTADDEYEPEEELW